MACSGCHKSTVSKIVHGTVGIAKAVAGVDKSPFDIERERLEACANCPNFMKRFPGILPNGLWMLNYCKLCGCSVQLKAKVLSEDCPDNRWPKI